MCNHSKSSPTGGGFRFRAPVKSPRRSGLDPEQGADGALMMIGDPDIMAVSLILLRKRPVNARLQSQLDERWWSRHSQLISQCERYTIMPDIIDCA